jgi:hypothetical protein
MVNSVLDAESDAEDDTKNNEMLILDHNHAAKATGKIVSKAELEQIAQEAGEQLSAMMSHEQELEQQQKNSIHSPSLHRSTHDSDQPPN